jgi:UDP-N-acetylmuramate--alanine ligase
MEVVGASPDGTAFAVFLEDEPLGEVQLPLPGIFNALNALAAIAVGLELEIDFATLAQGCASFSGVSRRFEIRGERDGVAVVDDYAHHPTEIKAALEATRQALPGRRIVAVFQPHLFSRTRDFAGGFASALMGAEKVIVLPIFPARERPIEGVDAELVVSEGRRQGHQDIRTGPPVAEALELLEDVLRPGDVLLTLGAGDVDTVAAAWLEGGS